MHSLRHEHINASVAFIWACKFHIHFTPECIETTEEHHSLLSADSTALSGYCYSQHLH